LYAAYEDYVARYNVIEVPDDYQAWEQLKANGRYNFIAQYRSAMLAIALIILVILGLLVRVWVRRYQS
ncbi:MAG: hypothetical protein WBA27_15465, partial [Pseudomonas neustonica]